jgi:hypothetical protein
MQKPKDRDYYRALANSELLEEIPYGIGIDWHELCVVLGERVKEAQRKLNQHNEGDD